jgi:hypothetical protein
MVLVLWPASLAWLLTPSAQAQEHPRPQSREARADDHPPQIFRYVFKAQARYGGLTLINAAACMTIEAAANFSRNNDVTASNSDPGHYLVSRDAFWCIGLACRSGCSLA